MADTSVLAFYNDSWSAGRVTTAFLSVYGLLGVGVVLLNGVKTVVVCVIGLRAAAKLHGNISRRREFCHSAAPRSPFISCFNRDGEGVSGNDSLADG